MKGEREIRDRAIARGIVYAAGWLCASQNEDGLAEQLLDEVGLDTSAKCRAAGADPYDVRLAAPALQILKDRKRV